MIQVENLYKKFGKNEVLKGLDLTIDKGGIFAVLGPNGSGKTTLIKSILGMVVPNKGTIAVSGISIKKKIGNTVKKLITCLRLPTFQAI